MFTGKRFHLRRATLGIESIGDDRVAVTIPANAVIEVVSGPRTDDMRQVDVQWQGKALTMFARDIQGRCQEITAAHS